MSTPALVGQAIVGQTNVGDTGTTPPPSPEPTVTGASTGIRAPFPADPQRPTPVYEVWATRYDDPHVIEKIPARGLSFSMPLSDHGECSFSATVEPGRSLWRPALTPPFSGVLVTRDTVPVWSGWLRSENQTGPRTFSFRAMEWGSFFKTVPARTGTWTDNDHNLFRAQIAYAQVVSGQDVQVTLGSTLGAAESTRTVNVWDNSSAEEVFIQVAEAEGGPEWYFGTAGTLDDPTRPLVLGDRLGSAAPVDVLHYVEDTELPEEYGGPPSITLLSDLFPVDTVVLSNLQRRGGNVLLPSRVRDTARSATVITAVGDGTDATQVRATATASRLLSIGWPRMTRFTTHSDVKRQATLLRHAQGDLATVAGIATGYGLVTFDGDPDWTAVPRGSTMRVLLDTDVYASNRPQSFESRLLNLTVDVPDDGGSAQTTWELAEVLEAG